MILGAKTSPLFRAPSQREKNMIRRGGLTRHIVFMFCTFTAFVFFVLYWPTPNEDGLPHDGISQVGGPIAEKESSKHGGGCAEESCDLFKGRWVWEPRGPLYTNSSCVTIPDSKNCGKHGRRDTDYMNWRWKPDSCDLPRFNASAFLSIVRGKKLAFIGDSVARNQMESLLCLLSQAETPTDVYKDADDRFRTWYFPSNDFTLMVRWTKFLIAGVERLTNGTATGIFDLHLDQIDGDWTHNLPELDFAVVSAAHWFFRKLYLHENGTLVGCVFCSEAGVADVGLAFAVRKAFRGALRVMNDCEGCGRLVTLVRTFSPAHFEHGTWNEGGRCNRTRPAEEAEEGDTERDLRRAQVEEAGRAAAEGRGRRFAWVDVTRAMVMRPDGHPGAHWNEIKGMEGYSDCVHWCLPGPIDAWNDLLLAVLNKEAAASFH